MRKASLSFQGLWVIFLIACSCLPACRRKEQKALPIEPGPAEILTEILVGQGLDVKAISRFQDASGVWHFKVELGEAAYLALQPRLEAELAKAAAAIEKKEQSREKDAVYYLWQVTGKNRESLRILFACPLQAKPVSPAPKKRAAIIVDDLGYSLEAIQSLASLKRPVTVSILPFAPLTERSAELARDAGLEMMLHLPLESLGRGPQKSPAGGMIRTGMNTEQIRRNVEACLEQVPAAKGVNNHTGSKVTEDQEMMRIILEVLKDRGLYFIDSRTTRNSVAFDLAVRMGVPSASRKVFIDAVESEGAIRAKLEELFRLAREKGSAVGICHPRDITLRALQGSLGLAERFGVELVFASEIAKKAEAAPSTSSKKES